MTTWQANKGNFYYGARYYDPKVSVWLSVDPLADEFPGWSPYNFTMNNPLNLIDPDGRAHDHYFSKDGKYLGSDGLGNNVRVQNTATSSQDLKISLRHKGVFGTRSESQQVSVLRDQGLGSQVYNEAMNTKKSENSYSFILNTETAVAYPIRNDNVLNSSKNGEEIPTTSVTIDGAVSHKIRTGDAPQMVLIGNIHAHTSTNGVSMNGDKTIDGMSDEQASALTGVSVYAADKIGVSKVNTNGRKSRLSDQNLVKNALLDYINSKKCFMKTIFTYLFLLQTVSCLSQDKLDYHVNQFQFNKLASDFLNQSMDKSDSLFVVLIRNNLKEKVVHFIFKSYDKYPHWLADYVSKTNRNLNIEGISVPILTDIDYMLAYNEEYTRLPKDGIVLHRGYTFLDGTTLGRTNRLVITVKNRQGLFGEVIPSESFTEY